MRARTHTRTHAPTHARTHARTYLSTLCRSLRNKVSYTDLYIKYHEKRKYFRKMFWYRFSWNWKRVLISSVGQKAQPTLLGKTIHCLATLLSLELITFSFFFSTFFPFFSSFFLFFLGGGVVNSFLPLFECLLELPDFILPEFPHAPHSELMTTLRISIRHKLRKPQWVPAL